jgi:flagellar hook-associated protein 3
MRIADNMITDRVVFNIQRNLSRYFLLQNQLSTGRRINTPSDDPIGTQQDLIYRAELAKNEQYRNNIDQALTWMQSYDTILGDLKNLVSNAKEIAISMANGVYDDTAREGASNEVESILQQILQLANTEQDKKFIFSGYRTTTQPLLSAANGVSYRGDTGRIDFEIGSSSRLTVNLNAQEVFLKQLSILGEQADLNVGITGSTLLADLRNGQGIDLSPGIFTITDQNLGIVSTIDVSGATDINDLLNIINAQLAVDGITNLEAKIGQEKNNILLDATQDGLISGVTALDKLNNGNGVDLKSGEIFVTDGGATSVTVDFSGAATISDIITAFNTQLATAGVNNVTMQINAAGTGLDIIDANGVPLGLSIEEVDQTSSTASSLGILGDINPILQGRDLEPVVSFKVEDTTGTTSADLGILGEFTADLVGPDLDPLLLATANVADLNAGNGFNLGRIIIWQGDTSRTIDLSNSVLVTVQDILDAFNNSGLNITASINADGRGIQIVNNDPTKSLTIEDQSGGRTAKDLGIFGSGDMMGSMLVLINALRNDDQEGTGLLLKNLDEAIQHLLSFRAAVGARAVRLEDTQSRLLDLDLSFTKLLSEVEDADLTELVTDLATFENVYQASLLASANIMQMSLLNFLK